MILEKEQILRYMRHIILPEVSGPGQKKLLESSVFVYGSAVKEASALIYYLAASGIGHIYCCFQDRNDYELLVENVRDLNEDVVISLIDEKSWCEGQVKDVTAIEGFVFRILLTNFKRKDSVGQHFSSFKKYEHFLPTLTIVENGWKGALCLLNSPEKLDSFTSSISKEFLDNKLEHRECLSEVVGSILTASLLSTYSVVEGIKMCLNIGRPLEGILYSDLSAMEFKVIGYNDIERLTCLLLDNAGYEEGKATEHKKFADSKVLIVGTGGLGSAAAYALCLVGVGTIGLVDYDRVEISNLNRQILHSASRVGMPKVDSAHFFLKRMRPELKVITYDTQFNKNNALEIIKDYDIVIDGVDNLQTRYLLNDACFILKKPLIEAGVLRFDGLGMTIMPGESSCYRCIFPEMPKPGSIPSCSEAGVLGPIPGIFGFIQAAETVKLLTGIGTTLKNRLLFFDGLNSEFIVSELWKNPKCPLCGEKPLINELVEYKFVCDNNN